MLRLPKQFHWFALALALDGFSLRAADEAGRPVMRAFSATEIQTRGPVRAFAECHDGSFLIGSNSLSAYDGRRWQRIEVPDAYGFCALDVAPQSSAMDTERVWVGAIGAIGFVERNRNGAWTFVSLAPRLPAENVDEPVDIRFVRSVDNGAVFVSGQQVFRWDGAQFSAWKLPAPSRLRAFADQHGGVWIFQEGVGLLSVADSGPPTLVRPRQSLPAGPIVWILPAEKSAPVRNPVLPVSADGLLVGTAEGAYRLSETGFASLPNIAAAIKGREPMQAVELSENAFAIGTAKSGVIVATRTDKVIDLVDRPHGLSDDAVYGLWQNPREILWIGLADGCALVDGIERASIFDAHNGLERSLPRKVLASGDSTYVLTDKKLYRVEGAVAGTAHLRPLIAAKTSFHDAVGASGGVWVGGMGELRHLDPNGTSHALPVSGKVVRLGLSPALADSLLYTDDHQLKVAMPSSDEAGLPLSFHLGFDDEPLSLVSDLHGEVWLSTATKGIFHYEVIPARDSRRITLHEAAHYVSGNGLPPATVHPVLAMLGPKIFAFTKTEILVFDPTRPGFVPAPEFAGWAGVAASTPVGRSEKDLPTAYWAGQRLGLFDTAAPYVMLRVQLVNGTVRWEPLQMPGLDSIGDVASVDLVEGADGEELLWIGGNGGLLRSKTSEAKAAGTPLGLAMREVRVDGRRSLELASGKSAHIGPGASRIEFSFSSAKTTGVAAVFYQTQLDGVETGWSAPQRENTREFTGLAPGAYVFKARRVDRYGRTSPEVSLAFVVIAPWYARWPAWIGYGVALALAVVGILRWRLRLLQRQTERLDRLVSQRTRELELSNTAKSEFLENISHEIRNPLNGIVGLVNLLKPERLEAETRHVARSLKSTADHLRRVSEEVLDFSKLEFGYVTVEEKPFALRRALRDLAALHEEPARRRGNALALVTPTDTPDDFLGDETKIKTIVGNFLSNAIKYAPGTSVEIHADWTEEEDDTAQIFIAVTDHGPGIPVEEQELIFQKFVRGAKAKSEGIIGSGIGLATCRTLARRMGGAVGVESPLASPAPPGGAPGTSFHLWLSLKKAPGNEPSPATAPLPIARAVHEKTEGTTRVLIVDDEDYNRVVLAGLAKELGYSPLQADGTDAAVKIMRTHTVGVVFLDLELAGSKGEETAQILRQLPGGQQPLLIATTGYDSHEARQRCRAAGMDGFLLKPFDGEHVREVIRHARSMRSPAAESRTSVNLASGAIDLPSSLPRAFQLYARGADESEEEAARRFVAALHHEIAVIRAGCAADQRGVITAGAHRLRTLGALVRAQGLNETSALLQERATALSRVQLEELVEHTVRETERLIAALCKTGVMPAPRVGL